MARLQCVKCRGKRDGPKCLECGHEHGKRGGFHASNPGGRPKNESDVNDPEIGKGFATRVLSRIHELKLKNGRKGEIKSAEDFALQCLSTQDAEAKSFFKLLLAYQLGKPVQPTITADTRENRPEVDFDGLAMPAGGQPSPAGKPN